jgi:hypothetical protein
MQADLRFYEVAAAVLAHSTIRLFSPENSM